MAGSAVAADFGYSLPASNAVFLLAETDAVTTTARVTNRVYVSGAKILVGDRSYLCVIPGTSSTGAVAFGSANVVDGTVTWFRILATARKGLALTLDSTADVYVNFGGKASVGKGVWLKGGGGPYQVSPTDNVPYQGPVSVYSTGTVTATGMEW